MMLRAEWYRKRFFRKVFLGILCIVMSYINVLGQATISNDTLIVDGKKDIDNFSLRDICRYYYDSTDKLPFDRVLKKHQFLSSQYLPKNLFNLNTIWIRLTIKNSSLKDTLSLVIICTDRKIAEVHEKNFEGGEGISKNINWSTEGSTAGSVDKYKIPFTISPNQTNTIWLKSESFINFNNLNLILYSEKVFSTFKEVKLFDNAFLFVFMCLIIGVCFFMGVFAIVQCIYSKDATYGFWALYLFTNSCFFFAELDRYFALGIIMNFRGDEEILPWTVPIQYLVQITYLLFLNSFLKIRIYSKAIFQYIRVSIVIMFAAFCFAYFSIANYTLRLSDYADMLLLATNVLILILVIRIARAEIPQKKLILIGTSGVLLAASFAAVFEALEFKNTISVWLVPIVIYSVGVMWELALFSLALSERTRLIQLENQQLQRNYTKQLETELSERIDIIQTQNKLLEEQRILSLTSEFEQKIAETEITALRSQMNPHFIFNCLNSIKLYSLENDSKAASEYLTKFSRLIRLVLENSRSEKVTLENEIETLTLYIDMEAMRFKEKVKYQINIASDIDQQFIEIPPLLIQPFVENAIWHGLMHKPEGGTVKIDISQPIDQILHIEISDNGIGREKAQEYKSKSAMKQKSFGMKVTSERIELINQIYKTNTEVEIIDLKNQNGEATGTKVILNIPF